MKMQREDALEILFAIAFVLALTALPYYVLSHGGERAETGAEKANIIYIVGSNPLGDAPGRWSLSGEKFEFGSESAKNEIRVKKGDKLLLQITSADVTHGFNFPAYNISEEIRAGKIKTIKINTSEAGEFNFSCNIECGLGHLQMKGKIIVE